MLFQNNPRIQEKTASQLAYYLTLYRLRKVSLKTYLKVFGFRDSLVHITGSLK